MKPGRVVAMLVIGLFALMAGAWTAMFYFARKADTRSVPLATSAPNYPAETTEKP